MLPMSNVHTLIRRERISLQMCALGLPSEPRRTRPTGSCTGGGKKNTHLYPRPAAYIYYYSRVYPPRLLKPCPQSTACTPHCPFHYRVNIIRFLIEPPIYERGNTPTGYRTSVIVRH